VGGAATEGFLIDTSAAMRIQKPKCRDIWGPIVQQGRIGMCEATEAEVLYTARSVDELEALSRRMSFVYTWRGVPDGVWSRVRELQKTLAVAGCHRSAGPIDLLVAVTAIHHRLTLLHYDRDFETVARHTELRTRWLADPGSID
jgi:predicted nucleic acid-binding protein